MYHALTRLSCLLMACMLCVLLLPCSTAAAEETIQVYIPVIAYGVDCHVALYNNLGHRIALLPLTKGVEDVFVVECNGLLQTTYTASVYSEDNADAIFDKNMYWIYVNVYYDEDENLQASVVIQRQNAPDGSVGSKDGVITFNNTSLLPPPTPTPVPYDQVFSFRKVWSGDHEDSIDWTMYNANGSVRNKLFDKTVISDTEWQYTAYFQYNVQDCYIIERVPDGYSVKYVNVGAHAGVTDRCYNGGTIINRKIPQTGDTTPAELYLAILLTASAALAILLKARRRHKAG